MKRSLISICIPAYGRPQELSAVLRSIAAQGCPDFEVVIADDCSPCAGEVAEVVRRFTDEHRHIPVAFERNPTTVGYDANLRGLLRRAAGDYCFFMGDDDAMMPGAIARVQRVIGQFDNLGVVLRSWLSVDSATGNVVDTHRYFEGDRVFEAGVDSAITFFRRSVFISGYVVHRRAALRCETNRFDGTLLYQLYLSAKILLDMDGYYISDYLTAWRSDGTSHFGIAPPEQTRFAPGPFLPEHMVNFLEGMLDIARHVEESENVAIYRPILKDLDAYAYGYLAKHAEDRAAFLEYVGALRRLGLGRSPFFWLTAILLLLFRKKGTRRLGVGVKHVLGHTPILGRFYRGSRVSL